MFNFTNAFFSSFLGFMLTTGLWAYESNLPISSSSDSITLDSRFFVGMDQLKSIISLLDASKPLTLNENCKDDNCEALKLYHKRIYNVERDLIEYQSFLFHSIYASKGSFQAYINTTVKNETLKNRLQNRLIIKDGIAQFASLVADVASIYGAIKAGSGPVAGKTLDMLARLVQDADVILTIINNAVKLVKQDGGTDLITETTGNENWSNLYSALKTPLDMLASYKDFKALRMAANASPTDYSNARAGVGAIIVQLLGIWASNERQRMKKSIDELDNLLRVNQEAYAGHYQRMVLKRRIFDYIDTVVSRLRRQRGQITCKSSYLDESREAREVFRRDKNTFGAGLKYYKSKILVAASNKNIRWDGFICKLKRYYFSIRDGMGKEFPAKFKLAQKNNYNVSINGVAKVGSEFKLTPATYILDIKEQTAKNMVVVAPLRISDFRISGNEERIFKLNPTGGDSIHQITLDLYGRVALEVVNKDGTPHAFQYTFNKHWEANGESFQEKVLKGSRFTKLTLDLPVKDPLSLHIQWGFDQKIIEGIKLIPGQTRTFRFVYDDRKFAQEEVPIKYGQPPIAKKKTSIANNNTNTAIPKGWVSGTLYNSNDGECNEYKGKYFVFVNRNSRFLNLKTGAYSEEVVVAPGENIPVAAPEDGGHFRVFPFSVSNEVSTRSGHVSFWYASDLMQGWWYAAGCKNGTKPPISNCDNGSQNLEGVKSHSSCRTFGE